MTILSKRCKPDNFASHNSLTLSFTNIWGLCPNFLDCESFLESSSPDIHAPCERNLDDLIHSDNSFDVNLKGFYYSYAWSHSLYEGRTSFCTGLVSRKLCRFLLMFSTGFVSLSVLILFPLSITFFVFMHGFWFYLI